MNSETQTSELVKASMFLRWMKRDIEGSTKGGRPLSAGQAEECQIILDGVLNMIDDVVLSRTKSILLGKLFPEK